MSLTVNGTTGNTRKLVCLVGFMGAGKTTAGRALADLLHWDYLDLDEVVEARERAAVAEIFSRAGQAAFRNAETEALKEVLKLAEKSPLVLALGGGAFSQPENAALLREISAQTVFLEAPAKALFERCQTGGQLRSRPLLQDLESFRRLYEQRLPQYQRASHKVGTEGKSPVETATEIARVLGLDGFKDQ
jgi:shikimate kinase